MKIVVLTSRFPYPIEKGDKLRLFHQLRSLAERHEVVLVAITEQPPSAQELAVMQGFCASIHLLPLPKWRIFGNLVRSFFTKMPLQVGYFYSPKLQQAFNRIVASEQPDYLYCQMIRTAPYLQHAPLPKTIDFMDNYGSNTQRWATQAAWYLRPILRREAQQVSAFEAKAFGWFGQHTIISAQDRDALTFAQRDSIHIVPNGVDTDFYTPKNAIKTYDIVFVGNMGYVPNIEAALFLVHQILPLLRLARPHIRLLLAGARPAQEVLRLANENVTVSGWIDDIRTAYSAAHIFVAPLFIGSGQQNKILESMAMGIPVVTTNMVNNAIHATENTEILLATDAAAFAEKINALLDNVATADLIANNALRFVQQTYSWQKYNRTLENVILAAK